MVSSPAFDYNIIKADILVKDVTKNFKNEFKSYGVSYNPPNSIVLEFNFETERKKYKIAVWWKATTEHDRFELSEKCWQARGEYSIKLFDRSSVKGLTDIIMNLSNDDILEHIGDSLA